MPMTQTFTPSTKGPSAQTIDFIRQFARTFKPERRIGNYVILHAEDDKVLGVC